MFKTTRVAFLAAGLSVFAVLLIPAPVLALSKIDLLLHSRNGLTNFWIQRANPKGRSLKKPFISTTIKRVQIGRVIGFESFPQMLVHVSTPQIRIAEFLKRDLSQLPISTLDFYGLSPKEVEQVSMAFDRGKIATFWLNLSPNGNASIYAIYYANGTFHTFARSPVQLVADQEIFAPAMRDALAIDNYLSFVGDEGGNITLPEGWVNTADVLPVHQFLADVKLLSQL